MLREGETAPDFTLPGDAGASVRLRDLRGKNVVVYFYPKDDTPGCTREAIAFSEAAARFGKAGAVVLGVSRDSVERHCKFRDKYGLKVRLLSDADLSAHRAYGAWGMKTMYGKKVEGAIRSTFLVGPDGKIARVWPSVKVDGHADQVLEALGAAPAAAKSATAKVAKTVKSAAKKVGATVKKAAAKAKKATKPRGR